jgi:hypothetical protein
MITHRDEQIQGISKTGKIIKLQNRCADFVFNCCKLG